MTETAGAFGPALMERLERLAQFSDDPGSVTRLYLSPSHALAAQQVGRWMAEAGMRWRVDAVGNVVGRYAAAGDNRPALLLGSHIDTVRNAGRYDGTLGVLAAIAAVGDLGARGEQPRYPIEVIAFGDEEGVRFPTTLIGSRAIAGTVTASDLDARDGDGVSVREALAVVGGDADRVASCARAPGEVAGYLELHIEQGPVLETEKRPLGVVTAISGATRLRVEVMGVAGHAGTVPMGLRHDALAAAAEMVLAVEREARGRSDLVATVGVIDVRPKAVNVIPGHAGFTVDVRSPDDAVRRDGVERIGERSGPSRAAARGGFSFDVFHEARAVASDPGLMGLCGGGSPGGGRVAAAAAERRRPRRHGGRGAVPDRHDLPALPGRRQPQSAQIDHHGRRRSRGAGCHRGDPALRAVRPGVEHVASRRGRPTARPASCCSAASLPCSEAASPRVEPAGLPRALP